jgi:hypothetical protein
VWTFTYTNVLIGRTLLTIIALPVASIDD